ncbi:MAG: antitoxin VapB family protein [Candidatus Hadarchaeota archaeon]|nr:antitoxin VapB family protein [Candidatus Hadarchaeota archaeon]
MAHKTLTISEDAYKALAELKREGESFTDTVLRLSKREEPPALVSFACKWRGKPEETKEILEKIDRMWTRYGTDLKKRFTVASE